MKFGFLKEGGCDGILIVVLCDFVYGVCVIGIVGMLQQVLEDWSYVVLCLNVLYELFNDGSVDGVFDIDMQVLVVLLLWVYEFVDGSVYLLYVECVCCVCGVEVLESFYIDLLMYQGISVGFYGLCDVVKVVSEDYGIDLEVEIVVIIDDVLMVVIFEQVVGYIQLVGLVNDVFLCNLILGELVKGFGFLQFKLCFVLLLVFVIFDELGEVWQDSKVYLLLVMYINGVWFGVLEVGVDMQFNFVQLVVYVVKICLLGVGVIVGLGIIVNEDISKGVLCFVEQCIVEILCDGKLSMLFMFFGDVVWIEMLDVVGKSIFGVIEQCIEQVVKF